MNLPVRPSPCEGFYSSCSQRHKKERVRRLLCSVPEATQLLVWDHFAPFLVNLLVDIDQHRSKSSPEEGVSEVQERDPKRNLAFLAKLARIPVQAALSLNVVAFWAEDARRGLKSNPCNPPFAAGESGHSASEGRQQAQAAEEINLRCTRLGSSTNPDSICFISCRIRGLVTQRPGTTRFQRSRELPEVKSRFELRGLAGARQLTPERSCIADT